VCRDIPAERKEFLVFLSEFSGSVPGKAVAFSAAFAKAVEAGKAAGNGAKPAPMFLVEPSNPLAKGYSPPKAAWHVPEGVCGFAWVNVSPGNCSFAKWLVKNGFARKAYGGGVDIWISDFGQSMERKEACANAVAEVIRNEVGVKAYARSRMD
jgi:hypothetical protein